MYEDNQLKYILTTEGRIVPQEGGGYDYQYFIKDHLGNTRVLFNADSLQQVNMYYPFGMLADGMRLNQSLSNDNRYLYNGKELQDDFGLDWYDYGARFYDATLGRFTGIDPVADDFVWVTPYNYAENSPITNIDLWGLQAVNYNAALAMADPIGYSKMIDRRNKAMENVDVKLSITAGLQAGGTFNKKGAYLNIASVDLIKVSNKDGFDYPGKDGSSHITQGASLFVFSADHCFDAKPIGYENEETSITVLFTNFSLNDENEQTDKQNISSENKSGDSEEKSENSIVEIKPGFVFDAAFFIGIKLEVTTEDQK